MRSMLSFGVLYLTACGTDTVIEKNENKAPNITIMSHGDEAEVQDGFVEYFRATVTDDNHNFDELSVVWYVGEEVVCDWATANPAGESTCEIVFEEGDSNVIAEVRDPDGAGGRAELAIDVLPTEAPEVELLTPVAGGNYYSNQLIQFSALVSDLEDEPEDLIVSWTSSVDGELPLDNSINADGEISDYTYLSEGNHALELRVEDSTGKVSTEEVVIQVGGENNDPTCGFTAPNNGDAFVVGESVIFSGTAMDEDIPNNDLLVEVSSNLDGVFQNLSPFSDGTFSFASNTLSTGTHTITLTVTDEVGADCSTGMLISIGNAPLASIDEPLDGSVFSVGETVTFRGTVSDSEDQANQIAVVWNSDIEGELQSGNANSQGVSQFTRSDLSAGVHSVSFSATDTSGLISDDLISFRVNTLPTVDSITLSPDPVYTDDNLVVTANGSDLDGQNVTMTYAWYENGTATSFIGTSINASELQVGETWTVRVTPNDGFQDGTYIEEMITISNTDPTVTTPTISPSSNINANSQLTCAATGSDLDDGSITPTYTWTSSGGATNTGATWQLSPSMISGSETITCTASVADANGATASSTSASVTVDNTPPTSTGIAISPSTGVVTGSTLTCSAGFNDLEDGVLTPTYAWTVNGATVSNTATYTVSVNDTNVGDSIVCTASVTDSDSNTVTDSASVTVNNTNPTIGNVSISPSSLVVNDSTLTCSATASDIDETVSPTFAWNQNGTQFATGATVDLSQYSISPSDSIECVASVADSNGETASGTDSVGIGNRAPIVDSISISNTSPEANETITCTATASDADGTTPTLTYVWMNGTTQIGTGSSVTLTPNTAGVGDPILCMATATDAGGMIGGLSDLATVINTTPTITAVNIAPTSANANDLLTCTATGNDLNDGSLTPSFAWTASGGAIHSGVTWSLSSANVSGGETITCTATVTDNNQATATSSASITLDNSVPTVDSISITPNTGVVTNTALTCAATISDTEDGSLTPTYEWSVNGTTVSSTATYTVSGYQTNVGDSIVCTASATDSDNNPVSNTASVTVDNTTPTVNNVAIATSDSGNYNTSTYTCTAATNDPDMNSSTTFTYSVGGTEIGNGTSSNLDAATEALLPGDVVVCTVEIVDGDTGTSTSQSASVTLANRAPTTPTATITWSGSGNSPVAGDSLTCAGSGSTDPDGQSVSYTYTWLTSASSGPSTGATVGSSFTSGGDTWTCSAVATDGTATSSAATDSVTIASSCGLTNCDINLDLGGGQSIDMVLIPAGDDPVGRYTITSDFYMMTTEVTQGMFYQIMGYQSYDGEPTSDANGSFGVGADYPAYHSSWHMAADFANQLTQRHNAVHGSSLQECYSCTNSLTTAVSCIETINPYQCNGYVLPTEAEWEYAARSGTTEDFWTPNGGGSYSAIACNGTETILDGSNPLPLLRDYAWYCGNNDNAYGAYGNKEVAQKLPNGFGLYDMHGNVWEWQSDSWGCSFPPTSTDPYCNSTGSYRPLRGGYWSNGLSYLRASSRSRGTPRNRYYTLGYRMVLHPITAPSAASIAIANQSPEEGVDDLYCEILVDSTDPQGDAITYTFDWTVDGATYNGTPTTTIYSGDTIPASETVAGEVWECTVTPNDGNEDGDASVDTVTISIDSGCGLTNCDTNLDLGGGQSMDMVLIPSGSDPQGRYDITSDFYLMTTEVTQGMFTALMSYDPTTYSTTYGVGNDYPAYYVNWHMAADFANKVTQRHNSVNGTSLQQCYSCSISGSTSVSCTEAVNPYQCSGYVLPTEAEWEYAAHSGTQYDFWTPDGGGNYSSDACDGTETIQDGVSNPLLRDYAWYCGNRNNAYGGEGSKEVGQKLPNGFGLYDMHGNLWEWTADWYGCSFPQTSTDPYCGSAGSGRVRRGGSWGNYPYDLRASLRGDYAPTGRGADIGFRLGLHP